MLPRSLNREFAFTINDVARMLRTYADYRGAQFGGHQGAMGGAGTARSLRGAEAIRGSPKCSTCSRSLTRLLDPALGLQA